MSTDNSFNYRGFGGALSIGRTFTNIIGDRSAADTERYKLESQGLNYQLQSDLADINADMLTLEAQQVARAYNRQIMTKTLKDGLKEGTARASFAARGIQMGVGSTANVFATSAIMREIDKLTMNSNKVRAVNQMKTRGVQADIRGDMLGVSASNMFASASTVSPFLNMASTLLTGAADFAKNDGYGFFDKN
tara:strand:- start:2500 stop:3075 length:576 start_codon:yes stop_codon:yes gene_type:complete